MRSLALQVGEVARRTGLTVRTLHHYDEIGLLSPSRRSEAGYRLYTRADVVRLQQVIALKQLGFSLDEVRTLLSRVDYSPARVLELRLARLRQEIEAQRRLYARLEALAEGLRPLEEASVESLLEAIKEMKRVEKYYSKEQLDEIKKRGDELGEAGLRQAEADWATLIAEVRAEMEKRTDPTDPKVQAMAQRWLSLVNAFTGGNPWIEQALNRMWNEETEIHGQDTSEMRRMGEYIGKALAAGK